MADSDDSDNEGGLGNVERIVMRPPGHSGKAKKGHLCFDAIYEAGRWNLTHFPPSKNDCKTENLQSR